MQSYQISLTPYKRIAGRFIAAVRREIQKALAEEHAANRVTQASIAAELGVNRSVIHRQIMGFENLTLGTVGEIAGVLGREPFFTLLPHSVVAGSNHSPIETGTTPDPGILVSS
ncbi:MAG TPA: hypothetical protein VGJ20_03660 [Xanthobacteraceae bacterium]|jgi:hypothetical protein